jgi:hypothetical protein
MSEENSHPITHGVELAALAQAVVSACATLIAVTTRAQLVPALAQREGVVVIENDELQIVF